MYICSRYSKRHIVHSQNCYYVANMAEHNKVHFHTWKDAMDAGCRKCKYCNSMKAVFCRQKKNVKQFCRTHPICCKLEGDLLVIQTSDSAWKLRFCPYDRKLHLYHRNTYERPYYQMKADELLAPIDGYHFQTNQCANIVGCLKYILQHDRYRRKNPVGSKPKKKKQVSKKKMVFIPLDSSYGKDLHLKPPRTYASKKKKKRKQKEAARQQSIQYVNQLLGLSHEPDALDAMMRAALY